MLCTPKSNVTIFTKIGQCLSTVENLFILNILIIFKFILTFQLIIVIGNFPDRYFLFYLSSFRLKVGTII
jgi:hypothetical protein